MASKKSTAIRQAAALAAIQAALGLEIQIQRRRDPDLAQAETLEQIAQALGEVVTVESVDATTAIRSFTDEELAGVPGIGPATVKRIREAQAEEAQAGQAEG